MSDLVDGGQEFDELVDEEWSIFQIVLGDHLSSLASSAMCELRMCGSERPLVVITCSADGSTYDLVTTAALEMSLDEAQARVFGGLDVEMNVGDATHQLHRVPSPDQVAQVAVELCREQFGVPAPSMLEGGPLGTPAPVEDEQTVPEMDVRQSITVDSSEELVDAIELAMTVMMPGAFSRVDTHFKVGDGTSAVVVGVDTSRRAIWVTMWPVALRATATAVREVQILNRDARFGRYYLDDGLLVAEAHLTADPFIPNQLNEVVCGLVEEGKASAKDFAWRTHGKVMCEDWME